jgi:toxin ParE1/3/4
MTKRRGFRVRWTDRARRDLRNIGQYISRDNPDAAATWVDRLIEAAEGAGQFPFAGRVVPEIGLPEIREVIVRRYRIVYRVLEEEVQLLTLFEGHRELPEDLH